MTNPINSISVELINNDHSASVFIEIDEDAMAVWANYQEVLNMENGFDKNVALKQAKRKLSEYIINIPRRCLPERDDNWIYRLKKDLVKSYYDPIIGFDIDSQLPPQESSEFF